ncbi:MAG: Crp/Fnr family transcriptional regulator [Bacteroidia bacterium]|nr:Crp/Fnr family transcriptional regulator [Bacteroidia bacterium]
MTSVQENHLRDGLNAISPVSEEEFAMANGLFHLRKVAKGDFFNQKSNICRNLAFVCKGMFRIYFTEKKKDEEVNLFFFREGQFMVSFKSFITQTPCYYTIQALEDAEILQICHEDLLKLFEQSHAWDTFGRVLAEQYFYFSQARTESFLFRSAEERYLEMLQYYPDIFQRVPLYQIASYLGVKSPSLSRIRKRISNL